MGLVSRIGGWGYSVGLVGGAVVDEWVGLYGMQHTGLALIQ